jgi:hypothetical protein
MHCLGPAAIHTEGSFRYEDGDQDDEREHSAGRPKSTSGVREKRLTGRSRWSLGAGSGPDCPRLVHVRNMAVRIDGSLSV